jgi:IclR family transcriptional regulator, KDG regulon repressor
MPEENSVETAANRLTSLQKGLRLIDAIAKAGTAGLRELADQNGFPPSTVHRLLSDLKRAGYVSQDTKTAKYRLSLKFLELGAVVREELDVITAARPHMTALMEATSETVNLALFDGAGIIYVDQVANSNSFLRMFTRVGTRAPLHCTGVGKACMACLPDEYLPEYWPSAEKTKYTGKTIVDEQTLRKELKAIRHQGYAVDNEEMEVGVRCVASAIRRDNDKVVAAVSISGPSSRVTPERVSHIGNLVRQAASSISADLGYRE